VAARAAYQAGYTALHLAAEAGYDDAVEWLLEAGADPALEVASVRFVRPVFPRLNRPLLARPPACTPAC